MSGDSGMTQPSCQILESAHIVGIPALSSSILQSSKFLLCSECVSVCVSVGGEGGATSGGQTPSKITKPCKQAGLEIIPSCL